MSHVSVLVAIEFEKFIKTFESLLGKYDPIVGARIRKDPQGADRMLQAMEGEQNLMIFWRLKGGAKSTSARCSPVKISVSKRWRRKSGS